MSVSLFCQYIANKYTLRSMELTPGKDMVFSLMLKSHPISEQHLITDLNLHECSRKDEEIPMSTKLMSQNCSNIGQKQGKFRGNSFKLSRICNKKNALSLDRLNKTFKRTKCETDSKKVIKYTNSIVPSLSQLEIKPNPEEYSQSFISGNFGELSQNLIDMCSKESKVELRKQQFAMALYASGNKKFETKKARDQFTNFLFKDNIVLDRSRLIYYLRNPAEKIRLTISEQQNRVQKTITKQDMMQSLRGHNLSYFGFRQKSFRVKTKHVVHKKTQKERQQIEAEDESTVKGNYYHYRFPKAMKYYRLGIPSDEELIFIEELEELLQNQEVYSDSKNPTAKGKYVYANQIFQDQYCTIKAKHLRGKGATEQMKKLIRTEGVRQGAIGDCYLISSLSSLASKYPVLISQALLFQKNPAHYYVTRLYVDGEWKLIKTDDRFSVNQAGNPYFAKAETGQIWVMLIEKCFAKLYGSYQAISGGTEAEAFTLLTGASSDYYKFQKDTKSTIKKAVKQGRSKGYLLCTGTYEDLEEIKKGARQKLGLVEHHSYSILDVQEAATNLLIKLRNPWGHTVWKGDWSQTSKKWTLHLRKKFELENDPQDGSFWIEYQDFSKYFESVVVCKINPQFQHTTLAMQMRRQFPQYLEMTIKKKGKYSVFTCQEFKRKWKTWPHSPSGHSPARVIVMKKLQNGDLEYVASRNEGYGQTCSVQVELEAGIYIIRAEVNWLSWKEHQCCINAYGDRKVHLMALETDKQYEEEFKKQLVRSFASKNKQLAQMKPQTDDKFIGCSLGAHLDMKTGLGFMRASNMSGKDIKISVRFKMTGVFLLPIARSSHVFHLKSQTEEYIGFFLDTKRYLFGYSYNTSIAST